MFHKPTLCALFCALTLAGCAPAPAPLGEPAQSAPRLLRAGGRGPSSARRAGPAPEGERARELLAGMTDEEKVGQLFLVSIPGTASTRPPSPFSPRRRSGTSSSSATTVKTGRRSPP